MPKGGIAIELNIKELYAELCPECQTKVRELIRAKVSDKLVDKVIGD